MNEPLKKVLAVGDAAGEMLGVMDEEIAAAFQGEKRG